MMTRAIDRRRLGFVAGLVLVLVSLVGLVAPVFAQSASSGDKTEEPAKVDREAYFTAPADGAVPATLTNEVPPGIVCILIPQVCGAQTAPVTGTLGPVLAPVRQADLPDYQSPQPVQPGTLPVGMLGGKPRFTSYVKFALPAIPKGSLVDRFDLVLSETAVSYALESPAFRQAILTGLVTYQTESPDAFVDYIGSVATQTTPLATIAPTGIELCAVSGPWAAGPSQEAAKQPAKDCIFGANGVHDATAKTWTFDLSFLAQAWLDGDTVNEGVFLGPIGADNLAFGDPDTSTNWQISLGGAGSTTPPKLVYAFSEGFGDNDAVDDFGGELTLDDADLGGGEIVASFDTFGGALDPSSDTSTFSAGGATTGVPKGAVASADETATGPIRARLAGESRPRSPWWLWLLLPLGLGLSYAYGRSLEEAPPIGRAGGGALTRLMGPADGDVRPAS
jgi:hypothetical protein